MDEIYKIFYKCSICGKEYKTEKQAVSCESKPISKDKGVKVGDIVLITGGGGGRKES